MKIIVILITFMVCSIGIFLGIVIIIGIGKVKKLCKLADIGILLQKFSKK